MTIRTTIEDGSDSNIRLAISPEGVANVVVHPHPPLGETIFSQPFRQYMTIDGTVSGSNDMAVNGATNNVDFYVSASQEVDIYIKSISVVIGDGGAPALNKYGALAALTNGIRWCHFTQEDGLYELHDGIKTNLEFVRIGVDTAAIGTGTDAFLADVSGGGTEKSYLPVIDLAETFGMPYGIRLRKGTTDRLIFTVRDDLTGLTTHNAITYGIRII
jgi:hypothetical protein